MSWKNNVLAFTVVLCVVIGFFLVVGSFAATMCNYNSPQRVDIESASMSGQVSGSFSIFGGSIDEEQYYFFYVRKESPTGYTEGLYLEKSRVSETALVETDKKEPHLVRRHCRDNTLYVPTGTVILDYSVAQPGLEK